jgi:hypothetical protein
VFTIDCQSSYDYSHQYDECERKDNAYARRMAQLAALELSHEIDCASGVLEDTFTSQQPTHRSFQYEDTSPSSSLPSTSQDAVSSTQQVPDNGRPNEHRGYFSRLFFQ